MPFFFPFSVPFSVKVALIAGSVAGASVAIINNKEVLLETAETMFQRGADYCKNKLEEAKQKNQMHFADAYEDDHFKESDYEGISTPETTDFSEIDTDESEDYNDDEDEDDEKPILSRRNHRSNDEKLEIDSLD